jgi:hypothetical protein
VQKVVEYRSLRDIMLCPSTAFALCCSSTLYSDPPLGFLGVFDLDERPENRP